jgi:glycosyltransferase involved in cell wall biosynthesis
MTIVDDTIIPAPAVKRVSTEIGQPRFATVLQVLPELGVNGGIERGTVEIAAAISAAGGRALVASAGGLISHELSRAGAEHIRLPLASKNPFVIHANIERLVDVIRAQNVDIVHARSRAPAWSAYYAARRTDTHFLTTFHGTYSVGNPFKHRYNSIMTKGEQVIAISDFIAGHIRQMYGVPRSKLRTIHRGVDLARFDPAKVSAERVIQLANRWNMTDGLPVVMLPGRLTRWKGQTAFIDAIDKLGSRDLTCLLVGSDQGRSAYRKELENLIEARGLGGVIRLVDNCNDMPAALMLTDVVVSASLAPEAFGRVVPEAQAMGRPVIATDHGGSKETVLNGETGWLVPPNDVDAMASTLAGVLKIKGPAREILAAKAMANVRNNFSKDAMCTKTLALYDEILVPKSGS